MLQTYKYVVQHQYKLMKSRLEDGSLVWYAMGWCFGDVIVLFCLLFWKQTNKQTSNSDGTGSSPIGVVIYWLVAFRWAGPRFARGAGSERRLTGKPCREEIAAVQMGSGDALPASLLLFCRYQPFLPAFHCNLNMIGSGHLTRPRFIMTPVGDQ